MKVPKGWEDIDFGELAEFRNGLNYRGEQAGEGLAIVGVSDFGDRMFPEYAALSRVSGFDALSEDQLLNDGDLVFVRSNGNKALIGRSMLIVRPPERLGHSGFTIRARLNRERILPKFAAYFFRSYRARAQLDRLGGGTNISNLSQDILSAMRLALPPLGEQRRIAEILGAWDDAIEKVNALIQAKQKLKRALMQQLLTPKRRFPQFNTPWRKLRIREVLEEVKRDIEWDDDALYRLVSVRRRSGGMFDRGALLGNQIKTKALKLARSGDFLISKMQIVHGASALVTPEFDGSYISGSYIALVPKDEARLSMRFFNYLSQRPEFYHLTYICSYGVHIEKMTFDLHDLMRAKIELPGSVNEQDAIADTLDAVVREVAALEQYSTALQNQKRGLMQKLLTGQVRVKAVD